MKKIEDKFFEESQRSLISLDRRILTEQREINNNFTQLCLQSTKLDLKESNDSDISILWLTNADREIDNMNVKIFHSNNHLIDFLSEIELSNVFLIVDHEFLSNILSFLDDFKQIIFIYIFINENILNNSVATESKRSIRQISNNQTELFHSVREDIEICRKDSISSTIFDLLTNEESSTQSQNRSFIWFYLLIENLFNFNVNNDKSKDDLIEYCRQQYPPTDYIEQNLITQFEKEYSSENAIRWYTRETFLYRQLNKAFRMRDIDAIFHFRYFLFDFQKQLQEHYKENHSIQIVYRGQSISQLELIKLKNSVGKCISFNTYLSATLDKRVALMYVVGLSSIFFEIDVSFTSKLKDKRFRPVYVEDQSQFPEELEVIFPICSTFFVDSIEMIDNQWNIRLKLTDTNDYSQIIDSIETTSFENLPSKLKFPNLFLLLSDNEKAERYTNMLIEDHQSPLDPSSLGLIYTFLGQIQFEKCDYQSALSYLKKALDHIDTNNNPYCATIYIHLSYLYREERSYNIALDYLNQALKYKNEIDLIKLTDLYNAFGSVYKEMKEYDNALYYVNQSLEICQSNFVIYPRSFVAFLLLGLIYMDKHEYTKAIQYLQDSLNLSLKILPKTNQELIILYTAIGFSYSQSENSSLALIYLQKAYNLLEINKKNQKLNPQIYIYICYTFGLFYDMNLDGTNTFRYIYEAYQFYKEYEITISRTTPMVQDIYHMLGNLYHNRCDYTLALEFLSDTLKYSMDRNTQILIMTRIGQVYLDQDDEKMALQYLNQSFELISKTNQSDIEDNTMFWFYSRMSKLYEHKKNFEKAIDFIKKAFELQFNATNKNSVSLVDCFRQVVAVCHGRDNNYIEEIIKNLQIEDFSINSKLHFYRTIAHYYLG
ncbi:unnamed protein product, partial [Adineta ricciae]